MATKYVSTARGNDSTGDGSAATPWKTIDKAVGSGAAFTLDAGAANTLYVEPGVYRESVTLGVSPTSGGPLSIVGDGDGSGFLAGGHSSPTVGVVDWRAWTDDHTPITGSCLAVTSKGYVTVEGFKFVGGDTASGVVALTGTNDVTLRGCNLMGYYGSGKGTVINLAPTAGVPPNLTLDRCVLYTLVGSAAALSIAAPLHTADWSLGTQVVNCTFSGSSTGIYLTNSGTGTYNATGLAVQSCTFNNYGTAMYVYYASGVNSTPHTVYGSAFAGCYLFASASSQLTEDGNVFMCGTANSGPSAGANSITAACPALNLDDQRLTGEAVRPYFEPSAVSPVKAFGNFGSVPTVDAYDKTRPATASAGALEIDTFPTGGGGGGGSASAQGIIGQGVGMVYQGDFGVGQVVSIGFFTTATLTDGAAKVLRDDGISSTAGVMIDVDLDATTGWNAVLVDTGASTFYADNHDYSVFLTAGTVGTDSAVGAVGSFSLRNRPIPVKGIAVDTSGIKSGAL